jgi:hypothetical protein
MVNLLKPINLGLAFLLELCMLMAFGYWGFHTGQSTVAHFALGLGAPVLAAIFWGLFMAPKAVRPVATPLHLALVVLIFGLAALALASAGQPVLAWVFGVVSLINQVLLRVWSDIGRRGGSGARLNLIQFWYRPSPTDPQGPLQEDGVKAWALISASWSPQRALIS